jgi:hypothetical protein
LTGSVHLGFRAESRLELEFALRLSESRARDHPSPSTAPPPGVIWGIGPEDPASSFEVYAFYESEQEADEHVTRAYPMVDKRPFKVLSHPNAGSIH